MLLPVLKQSDFQTKIQLSNYFEWNGVKGRLQKNIYFFIRLVIYKSMIKDKTILMKCHQQIKAAQMNKK